MASKGAAVASGADFDQATRRRNVPGTPAKAGGVKGVEVDEKKIQAKQVSRMCMRIAWQLHWQCAVDLQRMK